MIRKMYINDETWLIPAKHLPSPNCNPRPTGLDVSLLVIHNISLPPDQFGGSEISDFFLNQLEYSQHPYFEQLKMLIVSSHLLIRREGEIIQFVPFNKRAWHAGISEFQGVRDCNDFSIGIELEGSDHQPFTEIQYAVLASVTKLLLAYYPLLNRDRIVGHSDIAPGRKSDPGPHFEWDKFRYLL
jgi:AmpD protein